MLNQKKSKSKLKEFKESEKHMMNDDLPEDIYKKP